MSDSGKGVPLKFSPVEELRLAKWREFYTRHSARFGAWAAWPLAVLVAVAGTARFYFFASCFVLAVRCITIDCGAKYPVRLWLVPAVCTVFLEYTARWATRLVKERV